MASNSQKASLSPQHQATTPLDSPTHLSCTQKTATETGVSLTNCSKSLPNAGHLSDSENADSPRSLSDHSRTPPSTPHSTSAELVIKVDGQSTLGSLPNSCGIGNDAIKIVNDKTSPDAKKDTGRIISNLKGFSVFPNADPTVWDHLDGDDANIELKPAVTRRLAEPSDAVQQIKGDSTYDPSIRSPHDLVARPRIDPDMFPFSRNQMAQASSPTIKHPIPCLPALTLDTSWKSPPFDKQASDEASTLTEDSPQEVVHIRASKLEVKKIRRIYDKSTGRFKPMEAKDPEKVDELDAYVIVERFEIDKNENEKTYIDVKSTYLRDVLRTILESVKAVSVRDDKPVIEPDVLFQFLPDLQAHREKVSREATSEEIAHLDLLIGFVEEKYDSLSQRLKALLQHGEITYDLLWALFKPNTILYTTCDGTGKPRCVKYRDGGERSGLFGDFYLLNCDYLDSDGDRFGLVSIDLQVPRFSGVKRIATLSCFPLEYHPETDQMREILIQCGKKFHSLRGPCHRYCEGQAFFVKEKEKIKRTVSSRVMLGAAFFRQMNPNYDQPKIEKSPSFQPGTFNPSAHMQRASETPGIRPSDVIDTLDFYNYPVWNLDEHASWDQEYRPQNNAESQKPKPCFEFEEILTDDDYLICSPTIPGFCFRDKYWAEFAVMDIRDIQWSSSLFDRLDIAPEYKELIMASAMTRLGVVDGPRFDDIVSGKGRGLTMMLHGPPGLGKTLTAQAVAEHLHRPLYSVSAGELLHNAGVLEDQLQRIFMIAKTWNALVLLDEADVFLEARSEHHDFMNGIVAVFLRMLEWFEGVMFLTTNRASNFDPAILSRIHIIVEFPALKQDQRRGIWRSSLDRAPTVKGPPCLSDDEISRLSELELNGRQINNIVSAAHALATVKKEQVRHGHIEKAVKFSQKFMEKVKGTEQLNSYFN